MKLSFRFLLLNRAEAPRTSMWLVAVSRSPRRLITVSPRHPCVIPASLADASG
jgi:hypothetical protein